MTYSPFPGLLYIRSYASNAPEAADDAWQRDGAEDKIQPRTMSIPSMSLTRPGAITEYIFPSQCWTHDLGRHLDMKQLLEIGLMAKIRTRSLKVSNTRGTANMLRPSAVVFYKVRITVIAKEEGMDLHRHKYRRVSNRKEQ